MSKAPRSGIMKVHTSFKQMVDKMSKEERTTRVDITREIAKNFKQKVIDNCNRIKEKRNEEETLFG